MAKKKKKKKKITTTPKNRRPNSFKDFKSVVSELKKSVYLIVRVRKIKEDNIEQLKWITLGTGFFAAPNRFLTAAHVINNPQPQDGFRTHKKGDNYFLLRHDNENNFYGKFIKEKGDIEIDKDIFLYPEKDLGIIYVEDNFYSQDGKVFVDKDDFIRISTDILPVGSDIGILGYPLCELRFENKDITRPMIGNVLLRTDKGVINCKYMDGQKHSHYDFTLSFNPGNSGGPIFDIKSGRLISIVGGYNAISININEIDIKKKLPQLKLDKYKQESFIDVIHATYSTGFSSSSFIDALKDHKVI